MDEEARINELIAKFSSHNPVDAVNGIGELKKIGASAVLPLTEALKNPSQAVRHYSALTLKELKDARAIPALAKSLNDIDANVASTASEALAGIGEESIPYLLPVLGLRTVFAHKHAINALAGIGEKSVSPLCGICSQSEDALTVIRATACLGKTGSASAIPTLFSLRSSEIPNFRKAAAEALCGISSPLIDDLLFLHEDLLQTARGEKGEVGEGELGFLRNAYIRWAAHLSREAKQRYEQEKPKIPPRFRKPPRIPGRRRNELASRTLAAGTRGS
jgi:HEAT repeat protein